MRILPSRIRLQYLSNLRLSRPNKDHWKDILARPQRTRWNSVVRPVEGADLLLLGNIGKPFCPITKDFLIWAHDYFPRIFWVPGLEEFSSTEEKKDPWQKRLDHLYAFSSQSYFHSLFLGVKHVYTYPYPNVSLLLTPSWSVNTNLTDVPIYDWHQKKNPLHLGDKSTNHAANRLLDLQENELEWLTNLVQSLPQTICATSTILRIPCVLSQATHYGSYLYKKDLVLAHLYGMDERDQPKTETGYGGRYPWCGVNMYGHPGYNPEAFFEYSHRLHGPSQTINAVYSTMETQIRTSLGLPPTPQPTLGLLTL